MTRRLRYLVLHGPNLNLFGTREPNVYGHVTLAAIDEAIRGLAVELNIDVECHQSNHEGALIDQMQHVADTIDGCVMNAGAYTHTSIALHDCIRAMPYPVVEVHLTNIHAREPFRHVSRLGPAVRASVAGFGWRSYTVALRALVEQARETPPN
jgi:3-dehydroquinate dehydratase-2